MLPAWAIAVIMIMSGIFLTMWWSIFQDMREELGDALAVLWSGVLFFIVGMIFWPY